MRAPIWADCEKCVNKNSVLCMSCIVKYETAPYLNYAETYNVATITVNIKE